MPVPYPDPVLIALLTRIPAVTTLVKDRVGTKLDAKLPAIRITKVRDHEAPSAWEATPIYQVEVWAPQEAVAGALAWEIKNLWPTAVKEVVGAARVTHRWIDLDPFPSPDPDSDTPRYLVHLGLRLSGATS